MSECACSRVRECECECECECVCKCVCGDVCGDVCGCVREREGEVDRWNLGLQREQVRVFFRDHSCAASI